MWYKRKTKQKEKPIGLLYQKIKVQQSRQYGHLGLLPNPGSRRHFEAEVLQHKLMPAADHAHRVSLADIITTEEIIDTCPEINSQTCNPLNRGPCSSLHPTLGHSNKGGVQDHTGRIMDHNRGMITSTNHNNLTSTCIRQGPTYNTIQNDTSRNTSTTKKKYRTPARSNQVSMQILNVCGLKRKLLDIPEFKDTLIKHDISLLCETKLDKADIELINESINISISKLFIKIEIPEIM